MKELQTKSFNNGPIIIIGSLFFTFGFVTWINSILIPYFKLICELSLQQALLVTFAFYISYLLMAFPSSFILKKTGYKKGMILGLSIMAMGALLFIPAAINREYVVFLAGLFIQAIGLTLLQTAANPYIIILGPIESAASRMSIMGVCNKVAGAIAPILLVGAIIKNPKEIDQVQKQLTTIGLEQKNLILDDLSVRLIFPYLVITIVLVCLALTIKWLHLPEIKDETIENSEGIQTKKSSIFRHKHLILGAIAIFCAVGVEVSVIDTIIRYAESLGLSFREAKFFASYTLLIMIISYCIGILVIPKLISQRKTLIVCSTLGIIFTCLAVFITNGSSLWLLALLGFGNALLWPSIWPLSINGLGEDTSKGSALMIMGVVGGAVVPQLYGLMSGISNPQIGYLVLIPFYVFILYFAMSGYNAGKKQEK